MQDLEFEMNHKKAPIKDPIHDYIYITRLENLIIDTPSFQRLRFVFQNSTAYLTYPSNTNGRFSHSLGVMHISGQLFLRALSNANNVDLQSFLSASNDALIKLEGEMGGEVELYEEALRKSDIHPDFTHHPYTGSMLELSYKHLSEDRHSDAYIISTLWQAVRIGALVHDIGHLPMSHVFEDSLSGVRERHSELGDQLEKELEIRNEKHKKSLSSRARDILNITIDISTPYHEILGIHIFDQLFKKQFGPEDKHSTLIGKIVRDILIAPSEKHSTEKVSKYFNLMSYLHSLFANDFIDADRLDYTMRDPHISGVNMDGVDLERILDSAILVVPSKEGGGEEEEKFRLSFHVNSLSAIEVFFHQRYLLYRDVIFHHNVLRMNALLEEIIQTLLEIAFDAHSNHRPISETLERVAFYRPSQGEALSFLYDGEDTVYDDAWLRTLFFACLNSAQVILKNSTTAGNENVEEKKIEDLVLMLETFLFRKVGNLYSIWKRESDYYRWLSELCQHIDGESLDAEHLAILLANEIPSNDILKQAVLECFQAVKQEIFADYGVKLLYMKSKAKIHSAQACDYLASNKPNESIKLELVSPYLHSLTTAQNTTPVAFPFFFGENIKQDKEKISKCKKVFTNRFKECLVCTILPDIRSRGIR